jgi:hypothetical protein
MKKISPILVAVVALIVVAFVFFGREMYEQSEISNQLKEYESDFGPENFEMLLRYAEDEKANREMDFTDAGYGKLVRILNALPDEKSEAIRKKIQLYALKG